MPDFSAPLKLGVLSWNQYTDWASFLAAHQRVDDLGYDSMWTWDHLYPIVGDHTGPMLEAYMAMSAVAQATKRATVGMMVGANTFRNPALVAKMVTTLDYVSGGRAWLGIGAAWFETEHTAFGIDYGDGAPERLRWLSEALPVIRGMLRGERPTVDGRYYRVKDVINNPPPLQERLPIVVGGSGPNVTLRLVAKYADACNIGGTPESVAEKDAILRRHCEEIGRDEKEIERTAGMGICVIRDSRKEAERVSQAIFEHNGRAKPWTAQPVGTVEDVAAHLSRYLDLGYHHLYVGFPSPYDDETITRLATQVRPVLEARVKAASV